MKYYKLINETKFIGIVTSNDMRKFQKKHGIILSCKESQAQFVQHNEKLYRAKWMLAVNTNQVSYEIVDVIQIDEEEYNILKKSIESGEEIIPEPEVVPDIEIKDDVIVDHPTEITVEYVKSSKIAELSNVCNNLITDGIDVVLSDGNTYHFSLTTQDQLNLITLSSLIASGETKIPYHADGELCRYYSVEDILMITEVATSHKTYHVTYFNSLKAYVNSLNDINEISAIQYGINIPEEFQSDILKSIYAQMIGGVT